MVDIIRKKRDGQSLSGEEIRFFVEGYTEGTIPDYQVSALMMAIYFQKMDKEETYHLTQAVLHSGTILDLSELPGIKVDKHSTGGVGDKTTLVLLPMVAAAGALVAKLTGRGLSHTGGTMDKLEAFEGINLELSAQQFIDVLKKTGLAIQGQTAHIVPADKMLYALRDVTATVQNSALIACSIMSKKIASGADAIVLDVKVGKGAFVKDLHQATELAEKMVQLGQKTGRKTVALLSNMDQPLGRAVGNIIEVKEAIDILKGQGPKDVLDLCLELGAQMLILAHISRDVPSAKKLLIDQIHSGRALNKLKELVTNLGGDPAPIDDTTLFEQPKYMAELLSPRSGYIKTLDARIVGQAALLLGAGRKTKNSPIDMTAGIKLYVKIGDYIEQGKTLAKLYCSKEAFDEAKKMLLTAFSFSDTKTKQAPILLGMIQAP